MRKRYDARLTEEERWLLGEMWKGKRFTELGGNPVVWRSKAKRIYDKLGADNRTQAVMIALELGILHRGEFYGSD